MKNNQIENAIENAINLFLRKMAVIFLIIVSIIFIGFAVLYTIRDIAPIKYFLYLYVIQHIIWLFGILCCKEISIEALIMMYLSYILVAIYPLVCVYWNAGNPVVFSWYLLILIGAIVFNLRHIGLWILLTALVVVSVFFFSSSLFPYVEFETLLVHIANIMTVISTLVLTSFFAIVYTGKSKIEESVRAQNLQTNAEEAENLERDKNLYNNIIEYLEKNKPFRNPDFNARELAKALNSNVNYISRAISAGSGGDFHTLINRFRINYAKSMLDSGAMKKYTIDYIYTEAGYKYRSTFNAAFKLITGTTPSDYASQHNTNDNS
ncbi:MAG: AraC family transcriptional regulator [Candidatus Azobacteroides sp.]|nr:AraC family transcriptional regulator [Candidatus Azobacteroides sp.]